MTTATPSCWHCGSSLPETATVCDACGSATEEIGTPTLVEGARLLPQAAGPSRPCFLDPGMRIADRYRILAPLRWGGERAVYAADDLATGRAVALQLLPEGREPEPDAVVAWRRVCHPNVCRVLGAGASEGMAFLVLQRVGGESLEVLLRRIGRLPLDKGFEIAGQLAAGLLAIHEAGARHGHLAPGNVILDGRGRVRITGWGMPERTLSVPAGRSRRQEAYQAPERLAGGPATVPSDLYSLGAILYEILTGRQARASAVGGPGAHPLPPSVLAPAIGARLDRALLQCLEWEPGSRPGSAKSLVQVVPGPPSGTVGEVAGAEAPAVELAPPPSRTGALRPAACLACLAGVLLACGAVVAFPARAPRLGGPRPAVSSAALAGRARRILRAIGHDVPGGRPERAAQACYGFATGADVLARPAATGRGAYAGAAAPAEGYFWFRESPFPLAPAGLWVSTDDPPRQHPGEAFLRLDALGRLQALAIVPAPSDAQRPPRHPDWVPLLAAAGLDPRRLVPRQPVLVPPFYLDTLAAWQGSLVRPQDGAVPVRVEAGALGGEPLYFRLVPWEAPGRPAPALEARQEGPFRAAAALPATALGLLLGVRNLRRGRANRRRAWRLFACVLAAWLAVAALGAFSSAGASLWRTTTLGEALRNALVAGLCYLGFEPLLQRRAPERIASWSRVLEGSFGDPLVGRDLLVGTLLGGAMAAAMVLQGLVARSLGGSRGRLEIAAERLNGSSQLLAGAADDLVTGLVVVLAVAVLMAAVRVARWTGGAAFLLGWAAFTAGLLLRAGDPPAMALPGAAAAALLLVLALDRCGVLAAVAALFAARLLLQYPVTGLLPAWSRPLDLLPLVLIPALAAGGLLAAWDTGAARTAPAAAPAPAVRAGTPGSAWLRRGRRA